MNPIQVKDIDHVVLRVRDPARSLVFYREVLGCREERSVEKLGLYQLRAGSSLIDLVAVDGPLGKLGGPPAGEQAHNVDHFALYLEHFDDAAIRDHLASHSVEPTDTADRYGARGMGPSLYIKDPDGNTIELKGPAP